MDFDIETVSDVLSLHNSPVTPFREPTSDWKVPTVFRSLKILNRLLIGLRILPQRLHQIFDISVFSSVSKVNFRCILPEKSAVFPKAVSEIQVILPVLTQGIGKFPCRIIAAIFIKEQIFNQGTDQTHL